MHLPILFNVVATLLFQGVHSYDYVVIGGGAGGLTVASRLAEDPSLSVLVIEAGPNAEDLPEVFIPGLIGKGQSFTTLNWAYATIPQVNLNNRSVTVNAGKVLGGSTVINSMMFPRAAKAQYDTWGHLNQDPTWTWNALLPYFKKSEIFSPPNDFQTRVGGVQFIREVHGFSGRVKVGFPNFFYLQSTFWREASIKLGFPMGKDQSDGDPHAVGFASASIDSRNNTRCSAACAYFTPFQHRPNFHVITNATVTKIIWAMNQNNSASSSLLTAQAVEYLDATNNPVAVPVGREVICSAGTIGSPKVLELSGVGNTTILQSAGVTPVLDLPTVGENLADHVHSWVNAFTNITLTTDVLQVNPTFAAEQQALWFHNRTGLLSAVSRNEGIAAPSNIFSKSQLSDLLRRARADLTRLAGDFSNGNADLAKGIEVQHRIALELYDQDKELPLELNLDPGYSGPTNITSRPSRNYTTIHNVLYAPLSRGRTHITSSDPLVPPAVNPAYYSHPLDVAAHVAGIRFARKMMITPPMDSIYQGEFEPGLARSTDEDVEAWLRSVVHSDNHETGSLSMLPRKLGGVVDTKLKVYGTANVRVVDASIIPFPVSAHTSSTVYMIGERAAEIIKQDQ